MRELVFMDFLIATLLGSWCFFALVTMVILPSFGGFKDIGALDRASRAIAGGVLVTGFLAAMGSLLGAAFYLVVGRSYGVSLWNDLGNTFQFLIFSIGCAAACVWVSAKWLLRPVRPSRRMPSK